MQIKKITKPLALFSASAMLLAAAGCSDTSWSYKTSEKTLSNGAWIYYTFSAMNEAASKIEEETDKSVDLATDDFGSMKVEGKAVFDWVTEQAKDKAEKYLAIEKLCSDYKLENDSSTLKSMVSLYSQYFDAGYMDVYKTIGVGVQTFADIYGVYPTRYEQVFDYVYGKDGPQAVSDDELKKYFKEKYTSYYYLSYSFKKTDDEGNETDVDAQTMDTVKDAFAKYANELKAGKKTSEIDEEYKTDLSTDTVPSVRATAVLEDQNLPEEVEKAIKELKDKDATVKTIDDTHYMIYRGSIDEEAELLVKEKEEEPEEETSETTEETSEESTESTASEASEESAGSTASEASEESAESTASETSEESSESTASETSEESKAGEEATVEEEEESLPITKDAVLHAMKDEDFKTFLEETQKSLKKDVNESCLSKYSAQRTYDAVKKYYKEQSEKS